MSQTRAKVTGERITKARAFHAYATDALGTDLQRVVANAVGVSEQEYSNVIHGRRGVRIERYRRWCRAVAKAAGHYSFAIITGEVVCFVPLRTKADRDALLLHNRGAQ